MSATDLETQQDIETAERPFLVRTFAAELTPGDGRTVDVRIVPYGETAVANDGFGGVARGIPYQEQWMPGVFDGQANAPNRVLVNFEHQPGIAGVIGHGLALREDSDGYYGSFRLHDTPDGDKALMLVKEGVLANVSLEAKPMKSVRTATGIVQRVKAHLAGIALIRRGAYAGAQVLAVRAHPIFDEEIQPVEMNPETVARCHRLGIRLPQRYQAHPDETGTPADAGTPESGTRQEENNNPLLEDKQT